MDVTQNEEKGGGVKEKGKRRWEKGCSKQGQRGIDTD